MGSSIENLNDFSPSSREARRVVFSPCHGGVIGLYNFCLQIRCTPFAGHPFCRSPQM
jgi:hypothetical protein